MGDGRTRRAYLRLVGVSVTAGCSELSWHSEPNGQIEGDPTRDWLQTARDSGHTAYVPNGRGVPPKIRWERGPFSFISTPLVVGEAVYVIAEVPKKDLLGRPTNDTRAALYEIGSSAGEMERIADTENTWSGWGLADPIFYRGTLYVAGNGELFALNARTGNTEWRQEIGTASFTPVADGGRIFAGCPDGVCAYDAATGERLWRTPVPSRKPVLHSPAVADGRVVYVENDGNNRAKPQSATVKAIRADTGKELWSKEDDVVPYGTPVVDDGTVYLGNRKYVYALGATTGKRRWREPIAQSEHSLGPELCVGPERIYVPENRNDRGRLAALSRDTGAREWTLETEGGLGYRPVRIGEHLYFCVGGVRNRTVAEDHHASVLSLDPSTGEYYWRYRLFSYSADAPVATGDSLYVTYDNGPDEVSLAAFGY